MPETKLKTLIVDDSSTDRQTLTYLLTKHFGCHVEAANDGLEGLDLLSRQRFDLVFLDLMMPVMSGEEVLREIRACPDSAELPVVVMSGDAHRDTVRRVLMLGVLDYIVKPYNKDEIVKRLSKTLETLKAELEALRPGGDGSDTDDGRPLLLIADADNNFRHFVATTLGPQFHVVPAANGAHCLNLIMKHHPGVLLIGEKQGIMTRERVVQRIRSNKKLQSVKIYAIEASAATPPPGDLGLFDGVIGRSFMAESFLKSFKTVSITILDGQTAPRGVVEELRPTLVSAIQQVFGMMMMVEVSETEEAATLDPAVPTILGAINVTGYAEEKSIRVQFSCASSCVDGMAKRMLGDDDEEDSQEVVLSTLQEVMNITGGRIKNALDEQNRSFYLGLPKVEEIAAGEKLPPLGGVVHFTGEGDLRFSVAMSIAGCRKTSMPKAELQPGLFLAQSIEVEGSEPIAKGAELTADLVTLLQNVEIEAVDVFQAA